MADENKSNGVNGWLLKSAVGALLAMVAGILVRGCDLRDEVLQRLTILEHDSATERKRSLEIDLKQARDIDRINDLVTDRLALMWRVISDLHYGEVNRPPPPERRSNFDEQPGERR